MNETPGEPFDFRKALKAQKRRKLRKEIALGLGAFAIVFAGGMLAPTGQCMMPALLTTISSLRRYSSKQAPHNRHLRIRPAHMRRGWRYFLA